ncbi:hypothetical protein IHE44_0000549 [Lamprotornis superbus]|uniref:Uncharacterized protein n=2 Tax=Passeriformes TaxID=9126 RepID=A0A835P3K6_9PASS|nr:hypothetical protein IHE44_0000549 [Lamprotornis superbus]
MYITTSAWTKQQESSQEKEIKFTKATHRHMQLTGFRNKYKNSEDVKTSMKIRMLILRNICHQVALDVSGREFWSLHCRERCGDQISRTPTIPNSPQSQMEWPQRPLRKKKIKESSSLQGKSKVKWQPNSTRSGPAGKRVTGKLCRSPGSYTIAMNFNHCSLLLHYNETEHNGGEQATKLEPGTFRLAMPSRAQV